MSMRCVIPDSQGTCTLKLRVSCGGKLQNIIRRGSKHDQASLKCISNGKSKDRRETKGQPFEIANLGLANGNSCHKNASLKQRAGMPSKARLLVLGLDESALTLRFDALGIFLQVGVSNILPQVGQFVLCPNSHEQSPGKSS